MSKAKHKHTNHLNELLEHLHKGTDDLDAFDKEALEGFSLLGSEEEAHRVKSELDARIEQDILSAAAKPKTIRLYWAAAAGLFLLIGLITIFKFFEPASKLELAQNQDVKHAVDPPAETAPVEMQAAHEQEEAMAEKSNDSQKQTNRSSQKQDVASGKSAFSEGERSDRSKTLQEDIPAPPSDSKDEIIDADKMVATKSAPAKDAMGGAMPSSENKIVLKTAEKESDESNAYKSIVREERKSDKSSVAKAKKSKEEAPAPAMAAETLADEEPAQMPAGINVSKLTVSEKELKNKLDVFMKDKSYRQAFSCVLKLSAGNEIKDVTFTNSKQFTRKEEKEIINFLKELKCFQTPQGANVSYYTLNYQLP